jgi:ribosomal protein S18 acetylase RimI-like enzyme
MFKRAAKSIANALFGQYRLVRIYRAELSQPLSGDTAGHNLHNMADNKEMLLAADPAIREHAWFAEGNAHAFGLWENGKLACSCVVWDRGRFADAAVGDLGTTEAVLVDIVTAASSRQRGFAQATIRYAMAEMARKGYRSLVCTVWHNNQASIRAFEKAGWRYAAFVIEVFPLGRRLIFRFTKRRP